MLSSKGKCAEQQDSLKRQLAKILPQKMTSLAWVSQSGNRFNSFDSGDTTAGNRLSRRESLASVDSSQTDGSLERRFSLRADPMQVAPWPWGGAHQQ